ncbi:MAG TPA: sulfocyanin-like copper-binding protein [Actinomycetota bacterium]|nr:sulfocyanin-like copper-binding protein [Actinomycetota bacterium]
MTRHIRPWLAVPVVVLVLAFVTASCGGDEGGVGATLADFSITLDSDSAPAGEVTFDVTNDAEQTHEFVVFQTDLAEDQLPTNDEGVVDEEGEGVTLIDEIEDVAGGSSQSLTVNLDAGSYVLICNLPGHYQQGMHASFSAT